MSFLLARISEAFAKGAAVCCSPVTSFSATIYETVLCKTSGYIALGFSGWPHHALFGVALASSTILSSTTASSTKEGNGPSSFRG